jgi:hypothetical protein
MAESMSIDRDYMCLRGGGRGGGARAVCIGVMGDCNDACVYSSSSDVVGEEESDDSDG